MENILNLQVNGAVWEMPKNFEEKLKISLEEAKLTGDYKVIVMSKEDFVVCKRTPAGLDNGFTRSIEDYFNIALSDNSCSSNTITRSVVMLHGGDYKGGRELTSNIILSLGVKETSTDAPLYREYNVLRGALKSAKIPFKCEM